MSRPRVFISSANPRLQIAKSLQAALQHTCEVTVWDQGAFRLSGYPIPSLLRQTKQNDFAIQIIAPDVVQKDDKGFEAFAPNSNVLIEIGMFMGAIGQDRVFLVAPASFMVKMPSDLASLTLATYDDERSDRNWDAAVGVAAHKIQQEIAEQWPSVALQASRMHEVQLFKDIDFRPLVDSVEELTCYFIHSRRWRENNGETLKQRMRAGSLKTLKLFLPDIRDPRFIRGLAARFDDEPAIPGFILDVFRWVESFSKEFGSRVSLWMHNKVPAYSFYKFQSHAVIAFYTLAKTRRHVPSLIGRQGDEVWQFIIEDIESHSSECFAVPNDMIPALIADYQRAFGFHSSELPL